MDAQTQAPPDGSTRFSQKVFRLFRFSLTSDLCILTSFHRTLLHSRSQKSPS